MANAAMTCCMQEVKPAEQNHSTADMADAMPCHEMASEMQAPDHSHDGCDCLQCIKMSIAPQPEAALYAHTVYTENIVYFGIAPAHPADIFQPPKHQV